MILIVIVRSLIFVYINLIFLSFIYIFVEKNNIYCKFRFMLYFYIGIVSIIVILFSV